MGGILLGIIGAWLSCFALMLAFFESQRRSFRFDAGPPPVLRRIAGEALPVLASPAPYSRFDVVSV